jgi:hypothetical protein
MASDSTTWIMSRACVAIRFQSMSPVNNAVMESFFSSLKIERIARKVTERETRLVPMCSIMSNASTTRAGANRPLATSALWNSSGLQRQLKAGATKPAAAHR